MSIEHGVNGGWESVHQRLKKEQGGDDDRWRLRDWDDHPNDPGWENGTYTHCHGELRAKVRSGEIVFDTVYPDRPAGDSPIIRSAFVVEDATDHELSFSGFIFLDGDSSEGVRASKARGHKRLNKDQIVEYMQQIRAREAYTRYSIGNKPESISQELWQKMLDKAGSDSDCSSCSGGDSASSDDGGCS